MKTCSVGGAEGRQEEQKKMEKKKNIRHFFGDYVGSHLRSWLHDASYAVEPLFRQARSVWQEWVEPLFIGFYDEKGRQVLDRREVQNVFLAEKVLGAIFPESHRNSRKKSIRGLLEERLDLGRAASRHPQGDVVQNYLTLVGDDAFEALVHRCLEQSEREEAMRRSNALSAFYAMSSPEANQRLGLSPRYVGEGGERERFRTYRSEVYRRAREGKDLDEPTFLRILEDSLRGEDRE